MSTKRSHFWRRVSGAALAGVALFAAVGPAEAGIWEASNARFNFATPAFRDVWITSDQVVANGNAARSYTWGPLPWFDYREYYRQSPNGLRQVQYFDKARMEINDPNNSSTRGVTNGLLTVELVSGRMKMGDATGIEDNVQRQPAMVPVAGDPAAANPSSPTYESFKGVATIDNGYGDQDRTGQRVAAVLDRNGNRTTNAQLGNDPMTEIVAFNTVTRHNVPRVFRDFIQNGPVDGLFAFGYPITDPYWIRARVAGIEKDILIQLYERRAVTYTPSNPAAFRVEMGNVGQHYFQWRYPHLGQPWQRSSPPDLGIAFASKRATADHWETFLMNDNGDNIRQITSGAQETVPYSWRRTFAEGAAPRLMVDSRRSRGIRKLFSINRDNPEQVRAHTELDGPVIAFNAAISPDGTQIAAAIQVEENGSITMLPFASDNAYPAPNAPIESRCQYQSPSWLPDGSGLVFAGTCRGKSAIYRADLQYFGFPTDQYVPVGLINIRPLVEKTDSDNYFPRVSPDGQTVVFASNRHGQGDIFTIGINGGGERRLTSDPADDGAASWSANGAEIAFDSNRDGDYEIYKMRLDNLNPTQLTFNTVDDRWPLWDQ